MSSPLAGNETVVFGNVLQTSDDLLHQTVTYKPERDNQGLTKLSMGCSSLVHSEPAVISAELMDTFPDLLCLKAAKAVTKAGSVSKSLYERLSPKASLHFFVHKIKVGRSSKRVIFHFLLDLASPLSVTFRYVTKEEAAHLGASSEHLAASERIRADAAPASDIASEPCIGYCIGTEKR